MAVVAGSGAVRVPADASVLVVRLRLCMGCGRMTVDTRKLRVVCRDLMAIRTHRAVVWDSEPGVIKRRPGPRGRRVAGVAGRRIAGGDVVRDGAAERLRAVPIGLMAGIASSVGGRQRVVVAHMAQVAGGRKMRARKRKARGSMIKRSVGPCCCVVTGRTLRRRVVQGDVVRYRTAERLRAVPVRRVAAVAVGVGACEVVVVADMARDAGPG